MVLVNGYIAAYPVDGFIAGNWTMTRKKDLLTISILPFRQLTQLETDEVDAEARATGAFLTENKGRVEVEWRPIVE